MLDFNNTVRSAMCVNLAQTSLTHLSTKAALPVGTPSTTVPSLEKMAWDAVEGNVGGPTLQDRHPKEC